MSGNKPNMLGLPFDEPQDKAVPGCLLQGSTLWITRSRACEQPVTIATIAR